MFPISFSNDLSGRRRRFLPERLAKSARTRVLTLASDRAELTEHFAGIPAQIRWLELEQWPFEVRKNDQNNFWLKT